MGWKTEVQEYQNYREISDTFDNSERLLNLSSPFSKGAQAYFAFLEREKENEHEDFLQIFLKKVQKPVLRYRAQSKKIHPL